MFKLLRKVDVPIMLDNGLLLLLIIGVPYPTSTLAKYILSEAARYAAVFTLAISYCSRWLSICFGIRFHTTVGA